MAESKLLRTTGGVPSGGLNSTSTDQVDELLQEAYNRWGDYHELQGSDLALSPSQVDNDWKATNAIHHS